MVLGRRYAAPVRSTLSDMTKLIPRMYKIFASLFISILVVACAAQPIEYVPQKRFDRAIAQKVIEQILMEQPDGMRPNSVAFGPDYIGFDYGEVINTKGIATAASVTTNVAVGVANSETSVVQMKDRLYLNSELTTKIFSKRDYFVVQILRENGKLYRNVIARSESKARAFADSIESLRVKGVFD